MQFLPLLLLLATQALPLPQQPEDPRKISVGDHSLFLNCTGSAKGPTVILLSGAGQTTATWAKVQPEVSTFATVCSYDRMGDGASDHPPRSQTEAEGIADLHQLLTNAGLAPPYIFVGHSLGGVYARGFDEKYPNQAAGFVFVDSAHEEQVWRLAKISPALLFEFPGWPNYAKLRPRGWLLPGRLLAWQTDAPLIVLEHGIMWPKGVFKGLTDEQYQQLKETWHAMQLDLSQRSKSGELRIAEQSGHFIQLQQPDLVIAAIHDVLKRSATPH